MKYLAAVKSSIALGVLAAMALPAAAFLAPMAAHAYSSSERYFDREQIGQLTAPIALYPDPLLAQILSAATYPHEILEARRFIDRRNDYAAIDRQDWDSSVRAIARYPEVLDFLADDLQWTEALGIAYLNQPDDVADAIQRWRRQAYNLGNLQSNAQQIVYVDDGYVRIVPSQQEFIYIPRYDSRVVYFDRYQPGLAPFLWFGGGYGIGWWFDKDWDWHRRRICYSDRRHWRNGRPVFHPKFERDHADRDRDWEPDRKRFRPPERPSFPPKAASVKVPPPPADLRPGTRRDGNLPDGRKDQGRPDATQDGKQPERLPTVRRGAGDDDKPATTRQNRNTGKPTGGIEPVPVRRAEPPAAPRQVEQPSGRRVEKAVPAKVEQPSAQPQKVEPPQPQPQPAKQAPRRNEEEAPRGWPGPARR